MLYNPPTGSTDPNAAFVGKNVAAGQQGSRIPPKAVETPQRELTRLIIESGQTPTNDDLRQVLKAIRSGKLVTYEDVSITPNVLNIQPLTAHTEPKRGLPFRIWPATENTGECTLQVNGIAPAPLTRRDGSALQAKDIQPGIPIDVVYDGQVYRIAGLAPGEVTRVVNRPILWVRPDGNDNNKGQGNNANQAFRTIGAALQYGVQYLAYSGSLLTIALGVPGIYEAPGTQSASGAAATLLGGSGTIQILGDVTNQDGYIIQGVGFAGNQGIIHTSFGTTLTLKGLTIANNSTSYSSLVASSGAAVYVESVTFAGINGTAGAHVKASDGGTVKMGPSCKVLASRANMLSVDAGGGIVIQGASTVTLVGALTFSVFATAGSTGRIIANSGFSGGTITGQRYAVYNQAFIGTNGGGANFFPGSTAGTAASADQYN